MILLFIQKVPERLNDVCTMVVPGFLKDLIDISVRCDTSIYHKTGLTTHWLRIPVIESFIPRVDNQILELLDRVIGPRALL